MKVIKRDGTPAPVDFNRVDRRNRNLARPDLIPVGKTLASSVNRINMSLSPLTEIDPTLVSKEVLQSIYNGVTSVELDEESAKIAQTLSTHHPQYGKLASRIYMSNYHKNNVYDLARNSYRVRTPTSEMMENIESNLFLNTAEALWKNTDKMGNQSPLLAPHVYVIIQKNHERFEKIIDYSRDFTYDFIGMNIMEGAYLLKANLWNGEVMRRVPIERPQHMLMRVAIGIHCSTEYVKYSKNGPSEEQFGIFANWLNEIGISDAEGTPSDYHMPREIMYKLFMTLLPHLNFTDEQKRFDWADYNPNENYDGVVTEEQWVNIEKTYKLLSLKLGTHATPTLFNAGTLRPQCSSCYLIMLFADSLEGIAKLFNACMHIQKWAGGIGSHCHNLRAAGTYIRGTNGTSNGLGPYARVLDAISVYIDQGGGKRPGSHAIYLEPWHGDIFTFLELRKHRGDAEDEATKKARGMFYAIWNCDEFMWRLENSETNAGPDDWYLMCPDQCPGLSDVYNAKASPTYIEDVNEADHAFSTLYRKYISEGRFIRKVKATEIWNAITELQTENGLPYVMNKDNVNRKNQQANLGVIKSSNLCTEIVEYTSPDEVAVCNLASICLPAFIVDVSFEDAQKYPHTYNCSLVDGVIEYRRFDMEALRETVEHLTFNLDQVIDINYYPIPETKSSNMKHRPIGLGVQGLADTFAMLRLPFNSQQAVELDYYIFEMIYFASLTASNRNAQNKGPYETFQGSPASQGLLQFDLLKNEGSAKQFETVNGKQLQIIFDQHQDWAGLKENIAKYGLRNSLCIAPMPTASTSYIMGNSPCFEPFNSNVYKRAIKSGVFVVVNNLLINDLISLGIWNADMKKKLIMANGSVQQILDIPKFVRDIYVTAWDISPKWLMYHEISRSGHIDQSQSANRFIPKPNPGILTQIQFFAWRRGLKTGSYYIHSRPPTDAQKLQMEDEKATSLVQRSEKKEMDVYGDMCLECGS